MLGRGKLRNAWPEECTAFLLSLVPDCTLSYSDIAERLNLKFGTALTRSAILGKAQRLGLCKRAPPRTGRSITSVQAAKKRQNEKRKAERWAANPDLALRAERILEKRKIRAEFLARGAKPTSREYRMHLPRLPDMSKAELRDMLADAVRNTARMELA